MRAILLVAGSGRRLGLSHPKCLLRFGEVSLLERHIAALTAVGATGVTLVVGYRWDQIRVELERLRPMVPIDLVVNEQYERGSVISLWAARGALSDCEPTLVMDGDVLYPTSLLARLRDEGGESAVLIDPRSHETGEEMMVGVRAERAITIGRRVGEGDVDGPWDRTGESVGFLKVGLAHAGALRIALADHVAAGHCDDEYEAVIARFMRACPVGAVELGHEPWTEIDFEGDVRNAREHILPVLDRWKT